MKTIRFYAADDDLLEVLNEVEQSADLKYVRAGVFRDGSGPPLETYERASDIPRLGFASHESASGCESFLLCNKGAPVQKQPIVFNDGSKGFAVNELLNHDTATLTPAGRWGEDIVLYGTLGSVHGAEAATKLMRAFERALKSRFTKVKAFWVGPKALAAMKDGKRLTLAAQSPKDFDLSLN